MCDNSTCVPSKSTNEMTSGDAAWILSNAFMILTMQSGFGLLEAGSVSAKNVANIMVKNVVDVTLGGISYWSFGYGLSFGQPSTLFCGFGSFFVTSTDDESMGSLYTHYVFQFSFATAATTIVSGAVAERMRLTAYMLFSIYNTFVYCFPACWAWNGEGFLKKLGFHDFAGGCVVHVTGGASALAATILLGPRIGRFSNAQKYGMSSPVTALTGTFMLWWAWLAFNSGSSYGVESYLWKLAAKAGINMLNGSIAGGITGLIFSSIIYKGDCFDISFIITSVLGGLVGVTAGCGVYNPAESLLIGALSALAALCSTRLLESLKIDDPVGAVPVHLGGAVVSTLCVGLFAHNHFDMLQGAEGLFIGGSPRMFGVQLLGLICIGGWSFGATVIGFKLIDRLVGIRMSIEEEMLGADYVEHKIQSIDFATKLEQAVCELKVHDEQVEELVKKLVSELAVASLDMPQLRNRSRQFRSSGSSNKAASAGVSALAAALRGFDHLAVVGPLVGIPHTMSKVMPALPGTIHEEQQPSSSKTTRM